MQNECDHNYFPIDDYDFDGDDDEDDEDEDEEDEDEDDEDMRDEYAEAVKAGACLEKGLSKVQNPT